MDSQENGHGFGEPPGEERDGPGGTPETPQAEGGCRGRTSAIVAAASAVAGAIGATPVPVPDALLLVPLQTAMIASLAAVHGIRREAFRHAALPFAARVAGVHAAAFLLKLVPGLGSAANAAVAAGITGAMGWYVNGRFLLLAEARRAGLPPPEPLFDFETFREYYHVYRDRAGLPGDEPGIPTAPPCETGEPQP